MCSTNLLVLSDMIVRKRIRESLEKVRATVINIRIVTPPAFPTVNSNDVMQQFKSCPATQVQTG